MHRPPTPRKFQSREGVVVLRLPVVMVSPTSSFVGKGPLCAGKSRDIAFRHLTPDADILQELGVLQRRRPIFWRQSPTMS
jgi:hypothetical protein